jgi:cyclase
MIPKRIIPYFLLKGSRLVKGINFNNHSDVGDPLSQAMIYDAQGAEEIIITDITATREKRVINLQIINQIIRKCRLPIAIGGGIASTKDAQDCFQAGADKIVVNTAALLRPQLIKELVKEFGSANVVVSIDVRKNNSNSYNMYSHCGHNLVKGNLIDYVKKVIAFGAGELIISSIDNEGTLCGFECELYKLVRPYIPVPLLSSGGAGSYDDIVHIFEKSKVDGVALGKMLFLRDYDIVRIKSYLKGRHIFTREA